MVNRFAVWWCTEMKCLAAHACHGGVVKIFVHDSALLHCPMTFSIFLPAQAAAGKVPLLTYLSGLTCTYENFTVKAGAYGFAARAGIAVVAPDTSPRGANVPDDDSYDFAQGAGFYLNATQQPWSNNYQMEAYIVDELNQLVCGQFHIAVAKQGITGHSMGGHGALTLALKHPGLFKSISAFAPIVAPSQVPWGQKAFTNYLGDDRRQWQQHDACALMLAAGDRSDFPGILIDRGSNDEFIADQLKPELFEHCCAQVRQKLQLRRQQGYDHSYYFVQSFIADHLDHHAQILADSIVPG